MARSHVLGFGGVNQPEVLDSDIHAMRQWLRAAWRQLADPSPYHLQPARIAQSDEAVQRRHLRARLRMAAEQQSEPLQQPAPDQLPAAAARGSSHGDGNEPGRLLRRRQPRTHR